MSYAHATTMNAAKRVLETAGPATFTGRQALLESQLREAQAFAEQMFSAERMDEDWHTEFQKRAVAYHDIADVLRAEFPDSPELYENTAEGRELAQRRGAR